MVAGSFEDEKILKDRCAPTAGPWLPGPRPPTFYSYTIYFFNLELAFVDNLSLTLVFFGPLRLSRLICYGPNTPPVVFRPAFEGGIGKPMRREKPTRQAFFPAPLRHTGESAIGHAIFFSLSA